MKFLIPLLLLLAATLRAAPMPPGAAVQDIPTTGGLIKVFTYRPSLYKDGPLVLVFHGVNRNAEDYRNFAIAVAERFKVLVAAPLFDRERFPQAAYIRGGLLAKDGTLRPREQWTYALVPQLVQALREGEGKPDLPYYLLGHSAGGQFLARLAAFYPTEAQRIIAANPGSHLFPRRDWDFGYGFGALPAELSDDAALQRYLAAPLTLYLGTGDILTDSENLDKSPEAQRQGPHRYARGLACFEFAQQLAAERGWPFHWRKVETPGIGHDGGAMFAAPEMARALFGP
jgi:alpha-beta hydrolase superfamily lysophospholipase